MIALRARDAGLALQMQLLVYPALDYRPDGDSYDRFAAAYEGFPVSPDGGDGRAFRELVRAAWTQYVADGSTRRSRDASPLRARSLAGLPPTLIVAAEHDILQQEDEEYATRLQAEGVPVKFHAYEGQIHGFFHMLTRMRDAAGAVDRAGAALQDAFAGRPLRSTEAGEPDDWAAIFATALQASRKWTSLIRGTRPVVRRVPPPHRSLGAPRARLGPGGRDMEAAMVTALRPGAVGRGLIAQAVHLLKPRSR